MANNLQSSKRTKTAFLLVAIAVVFFFLNRTEFGKETKNAILLVSSPVQGLFWKQGQSVSRFFETLKGITALEKENHELKLQNQELKAEIAGLQELKSENEDLRKLLELMPEKDLKLTMADVTGKDPFEDTLFINKGSDDGISTGFPVITPEKVLVGRVEEAFSNTSRVILVSNKKSSLGVKIEGLDGVAGVAKGMGKSEIIFDLIPQEAKIEKGNLVVTTALDKTFPKGLLIGEIAGVNFSDIKPFRTARIKPAFNLEDLNALFIITGFK